MSDEIADLFTQKEKNFWKELYLSLELIYKKSTREARTNELLRFIKRSPFKEEDREKILTLLKVKIDPNKKAIDNLLENKKATLELYQLFAFFKLHKSAISSYFKASERGTFVKNKLFLDLIELYVKDLKQLIGLTYYSEWARGIPERRYSLAEKVDPTQVREVESKIKTLIRWLNRGETDEERKYHHKKMAVLDDLYFFPVIRGKLQKVELGYPKNRIVKAAALKLIIVNTSAKEFYIIAHKAREIKSILGFLSRAGLRFSRAKPTEEISAEKLQSILSKNGTNFEITGVKFSETKLTDSPELNLNGHGLSVNTALLELKDRVVVDLSNITSAKKIFLNYKGNELRLAVTKKFGHYNVILTEKWLQPRDKTSLDNDFRNEYGFGLNSFIKLKEEKIDEYQLASELLNHSQLNFEELAEHERKLISQFIENKLLEKPKKEAKIWKCFNPRDTKGGYFKPVRKGGACKYCKQKLVLDVIELPLKLNKKGTTNYIKKKIKDSRLRIKLLPITVNKKRFSLYYLFNEKNQKLAICIPEKSATNESIIKRFVDEAMPLAVIKKAEDTEASDLRGQDISIICLPDLLFKNTPNLLSNIVVEQVQKHKRKILTNAETSKKNLQKIQFGKYNERQLEIDIFNLLHELFPNAERLGTKMSGVKMLDSIAAIHFRKKRPVQYCIAWDAKYSERADGYSLTSKDASKQKNYIKKLLKNEKVKFFGNLRLHLIISNNLKSETYFKFIKKAKYRGFKGRFALIHIQPLIDLWEFFKNNESKFDANELLKNKFYLKFHELFFGTTKKAIVVTKENVQAIINQMQPELDSAPQISFERKELEK